MRERTPRGLKHAASIVFVLVAVLPLLVFTWTLYALDAIRNSQAQIGLALSLAVALLGFHIFRGLMGQLSDMIRVVARSAERPADPRPARLQGAGPQASGRGGLVTPGLGAIRELGDLSTAMAAIWKREATAHLGRRVLMSVVRSTEPIAGTMVDVTEDGVLLERNGQQIAVGYRRISGIELDQP